MRNVDSEKERIDSEGAKKKKKKSIFDLLHLIEPTPVAQNSFVN